MVDRELLLNRKDLSAKLTASGFPVSTASLATMVTRGGGPPYRLFGRKPLYRFGDALDWAEARMSKLVRSSSELEAA